MKKKISFIKYNIISFLKKNGITFFVLFTVTFLQIYWSVGSLSENTSSSCLDCSFFEDTFLISLLTSILLTVLFLFASSIKNVYWRVLTELILLIPIWLFWNYSVFVERESSWSTYLFNEEIHYTISVSFFPVIILSCATIVFLHGKEIKAKFVKTTK